MHNVNGQNGGFCHLARRKLQDFFEAIEKSAYTFEPIGPQEFFTESQIEQIASCEHCTFLVLRVYDLSVECFTAQEMFDLLEFAIDLGGNHFRRDKKQRLVHLSIC